MRSNQKSTDLNNDCLFEIFNYLQIKELFLLSETSTKFDSIISECLQRNHTFYINFCEITKYQYKFIGKFAIKIRKLKLDQYIFGSPCEKLLFQELNVENLKYLNLTIDIGVASKINQFFFKLNQLEELKIKTIFCSDSEMINFLQNCENLKSLHLIGYKFHSKNFNLINCKKLRSICFEKCQFEFNADEDFEYLMKSFGTSLMEFRMIFCDFDREECNCFRLRCILNALVTHAFELKSVQVKKFQFNCRTESHSTR